jgi:pyridoxal phosphate enzyme (YggS family)
MSDSLKARYGSVNSRVNSACAECGRPRDSVRILPVSKTFPISVLEEAVSCGMRAFGENYVQEACEKIDYFRANYPDTAIEWHLIGPLQSNKTRKVAERFDWVQSVDKLKTAQRLSEQRPEGMAPLNVLIEVHISDEDSKSGVAPSEVESLAAAVRALPNLRLRGLMAIPAPENDREAQMRVFSEMRGLYDGLIKKGYEFDTLSMGMSADLESAVLCGSTMVRIGSAIFGLRDYQKAQVSTK